MTFTIQLCFNMVRRLNTTEAFPQQTSVGFPGLSRPICTFTTAPCVISTRHCRCDIQYRTDPMATVRECNYTALTVLPNTNPVQCLLSFHDQFSPGLHNTHRHTRPMVFHRTVHSYTEHTIPYPPLSFTHLPLYSFAALSTSIYSDIAIDSVASCHQFISWDPENCGLFLDLTL